MLAEPTCKVARARYGNLINDEVGSRSSMIFRKRQYSEIGDEQQESMNISVESYNSFLLHSTSTSSSDGELGITLTRMFL